MPEIDFTDEAVVQLFRTLDPRWESSAFAAQSFLQLIQGIFVNYFYQFMLGMIKQKQFFSLE